VRVVVVGLGVQGQKRRFVAGAEVVATVDPVKSDANYKSLTDVPLNAYDAALVCTSDDAKIELLTYLLANAKHLLVEKPLLAADSKTLESLAKLAQSKGVTCYTAYNHRFEPHFVRMKQAIESGRLGKVVGLNNCQIPERCGVAIDDDVIHHFQRSQIHRPQVFRNVWPVIRLLDVFVGGQAGHKDIALGLCVK